VRRGTDALRPVADGDAASSGLSPQQIRDFLNGRIRVCASDPTTKHRHQRRFEQSPPRPRRHDSKSRFLNCVHQKVSKRRRNIIPGAYQTSKRPSTRITVVKSPYGQRARFVLGLQATRCRRVWSHFQLDCLRGRAAEGPRPQAVSRTSTVICLPRTVKAAWIFSGFDACSGIQHSPDHPFMDSKTARQLRVVDVLVTHRQEQRQFRRQPKRHWD
jgi:hypothetical protein